MNNQKGMMGIRIVGITGGIGSGKSQVTDIMAGLGARIIDADDVAKNVMVKGSPVVSDVVKWFGTSVLAADGNIDRRILSRMVFNDTYRLDKLNRITHKHIAVEFKKQLDILKNDILKSSCKNGIIVISVPLPIKEGFLEFADEVWVVDTARETRMKRIMERNGFSAHEAQTRMDSQKSSEEYLRLADKVIDNNSGIEELEEQVKYYLNDIANEAQNETEE